MNISMNIFSNNETIETTTENNLCILLMKPLAKQYNKKHLL
jgi:hypothetical protein